MMSHYKDTVWRSLGAFQLPCFVLYPVPVQSTLLHAGTRQLVLRFTEKQAELPLLKPSPEHQLVRGSDFQRLLNRALKIKESQMRCGESMQLHLRRCNLSTGRILDEPAK